MNEKPITKQAEIHTNGGASVEGDVQAGRDFTGRDHITIHNPDRSSLYIAIVAIVAITLVVLAIFIGIMFLGMWGISVPNPLESFNATDTPTPKATAILLPASAKSTDTPTPLPTATRADTPTVEPATPTPLVTVQPTVEGVRLPPMAEGDQIPVEFCSDELDVSSQLERESTLRALALNKALLEVSDIQVESQTIIGGSNVLSDSVTLMASDFIKAVGTPRYYPGGGPDEYCVSIVVELVNAEAE